MPVVIDEAFALSANCIGHLKRWPAHFFSSLRERGTRAALPISSEWSGLVTACRCLRERCERMRVEALVDARCLGSLAASQPHVIGSDGQVDTPAVYGSGEEIDLGLHPAPIDSESLEQSRTERHFPITLTLALVNADHHP